MDTDIKTMKAFQDACNIHGSFALPDIQRHFRQWQKADISSETYVTNHLPTPDCISVAQFCTDSCIDNTVKTLLAMKKDGVLIFDTLCGPYISNEDAAKEKVLLTDYKPLRALFKQIQETMPEQAGKTAYGNYCAQNVEIGLCRTVYICSSQGEQFYHETKKDIVISSIKEWLSSKEKTVTVNPKVEPEITPEPKPCKRSKTILEEQPLSVVDGRYVSLCSIANEIAVETSSDFDYRRNSVINRCRDKLNRFIEANNAWGLEVLDACELSDAYVKTGELYVAKESVESLKRHLYLWISAFGKSDSEKLTMLLNSKVATFPKTVKLLSEYYLDAKRAETDACAKSTVDYLLDILPTELTDLTDDEIADNIIAMFFDETKRVNQESITRFLYVKSISNRQYINNTYVKHDVDVSAYELQDFAVMQSICMSDVEIQKLDLVQKAVNNPRFAAAWLFVIMHFFAAWRSTDIVRLPVPELPYSAEETLERIGDGRFTIEEAVSIAAFEIASVTSREMKPHKTLRFSNVTPLELYVNSKLKPVFGLVLAIRTAHYQMDTNEPELAKKVSDIYTLGRFFGTDFVKACGNKNFSTRKANKALLQSIENIETGASAYLFPAIMRNHKMAYGAMSPTTAIYLQDNNFSGVTPQFVVEQMGERGFCGFLTQALLEAAYGPAFAQLPIKSQTALITHMGIRAIQLDGINEMLAQSEQMANAAIQELLQDATNKQETAKAILLRFINGKGKGKSGTCALLAAGKTCTDPARPNCIGCIFEVLERKLILKLKSEMNRVSLMMETDEIKENSVESERYQYLLEQVVIPKIVEICSTVKDYASQEELRLLLEIAEKGIETIDAAS